MADQWYVREADEIIRQLNSDAAAGLEPKAARSALRTEGANGVYTVKRTSALECAGRIIFDFGTVLLVLTVALAAVADGMAEAAVIFALLVLSTLLEVFSYTGALRVLEGAAHFCIPRARVIRGGKLCDVDSQTVVRGDILYIEPGDSVPCDCRIISSNRLTVSEKGLTENNGAVAKNSAALPKGREIPPHGQTNMLFAGSSVISGNCRAVAVETGDSTLVCAIHGSISPATHERLPLLKSLRNYCRTVSLTMTAAVLVLTVIDMTTSLSGLGIDGVFITSLALAVASMSEFFVSVGYIAVAHAVRNAAGEDDGGFGSSLATGISGFGGECFKTGVLKNGAVIKNAAALPELCRFDCIAIRDSAAVRTGDIEACGWYDGVRFRERTDGKEAGLMRLLVDAAYTCGITTLTALDDDPSAIRDADAVRFSTLIEKLQKTTPVSRDETLKLCETVRPGDENSIYRTALLSRGSDFTSISVSGVRALLINCAIYKDGGENKPLTTQKREEILAAADRLERQAKRTYGVALKPSVYNSLRRISMLQSGMCFEGFFAVEERAADGTAAAVKELKDAGIRTVLFMDSSEIYSRYYAASLGVSRDSDVPVAAADIAGMSDGDLDRLCAVENTYTGLDKVLRLRVVRSLQRCGRTVAYVGEGREDTRVLTAADAAFACEVPDSGDTAAAAYSRSSAGTARTAADVLIRKPVSGDGGLADAIRASENARAVYANLKNAAAYLITSQVARFLLALCAMISKLTPLTPVQILTWGLIFDFAAVLAAVFQEPSDGCLSVKNTVANEFVSKKSVLRSALFGTFTAAIIFIGALVAAEITGDTGASGCFAFTAAIVSSTVICAENIVQNSIFDRSSRVNPLYTVFALTAAVFTAAVAVSPYAALAFGLTFSSPAVVGAAVLPAIVIAAAYEVFKKLKK